MRRLKMDGITGLFHSVILLIAFGKFVSSCIYKAVGERVEIPLDIKELQEENHLIWKHNEIKVYSRRGSNVKIRIFDVDHNGSLILENIQKKQSGKFEGEVYDKDGKLIKKITHQLCVQEPVPEPTVMVECVEKGVNLSCNPFKGANEDKKHTKEENSNNENLNDAVSETKLLFGLDFWWMLVILTAGASLLLILFIICLVCVCRCSARNKRKAKEEAEFRLVSLMPDNTDQPDVQYMQKTGSHGPSKSMRPLPPLPSPRGLQAQ